MDINRFHATGLFLYPLKTSENLLFSDVSGGIERPEAWNESMLFVKYFCLKGAWKIGILKKLR